MKNQRKNLFPIPFYKFFESFSFFICKRLSFFFECKLTTSCINIISHSMTYSRWDSYFFERILKFFHDDLPCWLVSCSHNSLSRIIWDKVHMSESSFEEMCEFSCKFRLICHSCYHDIFIKYSFIGLCDVFIEGCHKIWDWIRVLNRHDAFASLIIGCMKRDRK